jgi:glyoxylase-like metal-dependent hydrolase (beta-lactamase superfamily II)
VLTTPPVAPEALPKQTYIGGSITLEAGGRIAVLTHVNNAHTDGDIWVYFPDANVLCTGDTMNNTKRHQTIDFANGGDIRGAIRATEVFLALANEDTRVMTGHGPLAKRSDVAEYHAMLKVARERVFAVAACGNDNPIKVEPKNVVPIAGWGVGPIERADLGTKRLQKLKTATSIRLTAQALHARFDLSRQPRYLTQEFILIVHASDDAAGPRFVFLKRRRRRRHKPS